MSKKLYIKTYGCQMNVYDSDRMADLMAPHGYTACDTPDEADLVVLNTCHIREKAEDKVYSDLGRMRKLRAEKEKAGGGKMLIAVGGCVGQAEGDEITRRAPYVDMVFGSQSYHTLPDLVTRALRGERPEASLDFSPEPKFDFLLEQSSAPGSTFGKAEFVTVQEGCDKFCTFCVVPYTRGAELSRKAGDVMTEVRNLAERGVMEVTLLGQNVNAYHGTGPDGSDWTLAKLIREIANVDGIERIRYTTSHPRDMDDELIAAHGEVEELMPYLHLPIQSGSNNTLSKMNRRHQADFYLNIIEKLRKVRPDIALSSDFIVGFPGETDLDFAATLRLVETVGYAQAYSFAYSPRPGTPAAADENQVPQEVKNERLQQLQALLVRQQTAFNKASVGKSMKVLLDRKGKFEGQLLGKSPYMQSVHVQDAEVHVDSIVEVTITEGHQNSLTGIIGNPEERQRVG
ncbi:MAG TPA: tRNA (N6-isopentenyl adenosine(37)-C2)-methylthiotransferase MiaB [Rickettsiales bacterium]|nr:tRNA (N6-isopentenyl adenosine(37)-C2)-methylthiotransferase MiaB [Rickettsiales bacterium]